MDVEVDTVTTSPSGIRLGGVLKYRPGGPIRFVEVYVPWEMLTWEFILECARRYEMLRAAEPEGDPLF